MARTAADHIATYQGFPARDAADLRLAVEEAVALLLDSDAPGGWMVFDLQGKAGIVAVEAQIEQPTDTPIPHERIDRFEAAAGSLVDSWKLDPDEHRLWLQKSI